MSEESGEPEEKKTRKRPLSRSRKLGGRRRRGRAAKEAKQEEAEAEAPAEASEEAAPPEAGSEASSSDDSDQTVAVNKLPSPEGSGTPELDKLPPPPTAEKVAKLKGAARRFGLDFSNYLVDLGQSAHQQGLDFNKKVVKPFSHALFEAAICLSILFLMGILGLKFGAYLRAVTSPGGQVVSFQNREVRPGQSIDESFLNQGFDTKELHKRANRVLEDHLRALRSSQFVEAYSLLSPAWKEQLAYPTFENGYLTTQVLAYEIGRVETLDARRIRLRAELKVKEGGSEKLYQAVYIAILTRDGWRLDGGTFK